MGRMTEGRALRRIADPVVAGAPAGVRIRTRIHPVAAEAAALAAIGELLGSVYRCELAGRVRLGWLDPRAQAAWRAERKRAVTGMSSSRWAGAITRAVEDQYQLGMRGLACYVGDLRAAIEALEHRCALGPGELALASDDCESGRDGGRSRRWRGYRSRAERFAKTRRLAILRGRLAVTQEALSVGRPSVTVGGKRLWRNRNHLAVTGMSEQQWRERWCAARMFLTADGESGKAGEMRPSALTGRGGCALRCPRTWSTIWAATSRSVRRCNVHYTFANFNDVATYANLVAQVGVGRVCFSADYPFGSMRAARAFLDNLPLSDDDRASISHRNAERLLGL
jgi:hypothetical protein